MDAIVLDHMKQYLAAGAARDLTALDAFYAPSFENITMDRTGKVKRINKPEAMEALRQQRQTLPAMEEVIFLDTAAYGDYCSLMMRMEKNDYFVLYHLVWHTAGGQYYIVREFTIEEDLSEVLSLLRPARQLA